MIDANIKQLANDLEQALRREAKMPHANMSFCLDFAEAVKMLLDDYLSRDDLRPRDEVNYGIVEDE